MILASIIEREAVTQDDRPLVASVFYNRLKQDMALQSDATMGYVLDREVTAEDLKTQSPYNTYLNKGLTPTPICTPSTASLKAALEPASTDYLYFFIVENGSYSNHSFSKTYEEHQQAIETAKKCSIVAVYTCCCDSHEFAAGLKICGVVAFGGYRRACSCRYTLYFA